MEVHEAAINIVIEEIATLLASGYLRLLRARNLRDTVVSLAPPPAKGLPDNLLEPSADRILRIPRKNGG